MPSPQPTDTPAAAPALAGSSTNASATTSSAEHARGAKGKEKSNGWSWGALSSTLPPAAVAKALDSADPQTTPPPKKAAAKKPEKAAQKQQEKGAPTEGRAPPPTEPTSKHVDVDRFADVVYYPTSDHPKDGERAERTEGRGSNEKSSRNGKKRDTSPSPGRHERDRGRDDRYRTHDRSARDDRSYDRDWRYRDDRAGARSSRGGRDRQSDRYTDDRGRERRSVLYDQQDSHERDYRYKRKSSPSGGGSGPAQDAPSSKRHRSDAHLNGSNRDERDKRGKSWREEDEKAWNGSSWRDRRRDDDHASRHPSARSSRADRWGDPDTRDRPDWGDESGRRHRSRSKESHRSKRSERERETNAGDANDRAQRDSSPGSRRSGEDRTPTAQDTEAARRERERIVYEEIPQKARPNEGYVRLDQVGEGTYGQVFKAKAERTGALVAMKKIRMESEKDGFPITAMREIKLLQTLRHPNVVRLHEIMVSKASVYMIFDYLEHDLNGVLANPAIDFKPEHLKSLSKQLLEGLEYLHKRSVLHRDIKGSNLLISRNGLLKLADFGLARLYAKRRQEDHTNRVITLWYRPMELLYGATQYSGEVDMWGAGCIFLELFTRKPVFQGFDEIHQTQVVTELLGPYTTERWAGVDELPWYGLIQSAMSDSAQQTEGLPEIQEAVLDADASAARFRSMFRKWMSPAALDLALHLLHYDPKRRATATEALASPYFVEEQPEARIPFEIFDNVQGEWHEFESRKARRKKQAAAKDKEGDEADSTLIASAQVPDMLSVDVPPPVVIT